MTVRLRRATESDIPFLMRAERGEGAGSAEAAAEYERFVGRSPAEEHRAFLADPTRAVWIAEEGGAPAGYVLVQDLDSPEGNLRFRRVVALAPGRGFASRALPPLIDWVFGEAGAARLWLHTRFENARARHVYEKIGMTLTEPGGPERQCVYAIMRDAWLGRR